MSYANGYADWEVSPIDDDALDALLSPRPVLQASLFCTAVHSDAQGRLTMVGAFHTLPRGSAPEFVLMNLWRHDSPDSEEFRELLEMRDPDGRVLGELRASPFHLGGDTRRHFNYVRFTSVNLTALGCHEVRITLVDIGAQAVAVTASTPLLVV
ncbi:MAG TPA: hypothetical protein VGK74_09295 [Symbiobacteriaceae bacterium]